MLVKLFKSRNLSAEDDCDLLVIAAANFFFFWVLFVLFALFVTFVPCGGAKLRCGPCTTPSNFLGRRVLPNQFLRLPTVTFHTPTINRLAFIRLLVVSFYLFEHFECSQEPMSRYLYWHSPFGLCPCFNRIYQASNGAATVYNPTCFGTITLLVCRTPIALYYHFQSPYLMSFYPCPLVLHINETIISNSF